jgi:hypothetical protein
VRVQPKLPAQHKVLLSKQDSQLARDQSAPNKAMGSAKQGSGKGNRVAARKGSPASASKSQARSKPGGEASKR